MFLGYIDPGSGFTFFGLGAQIIALLLGFLGILLLLFKKIFAYLKKGKKITLVIFLTLIALSLIITGVIMNKEESKFNKKIIILGFDGLSPDIIEPMMKETSLPNFKRLKELGSYRRLLTTNPAQSPIAWAGFATGCNPGKNGIFDFIKRNPRNYRLTLSFFDIEQTKPRRVIKSKYFWEYTSKARIPAVIIGCPDTFPPGKIYGRILSGMGVPDILGTEGTFTFYTTEYLDTEADIGGKVFRIKHSSIMVINLIGPRTAMFGVKTDNLKVPVKVMMKEDNSGIAIEYQHNKFELKKGQWSEWREVTFRLGLFKQIKGIFKFYLVETYPEFKLYISPINFDPLKPLFPISYPKGYSKELAENIGLYHTQGMPIDTWAINEKWLAEDSLLEMANEVLREKKKMLDFELKRFKKGILFCYFESPDIIQHMFWRYIDRGHPLYEEDENYRGVIKDWYRKLDAILGEVMQTLAKEDTLIVLSDHGFNTFRRAVHINSWLREKGYLKLKNPFIKSGGELLQDIDWQKTKAYAIGFGSIYINQKGRERYGIVEPGTESENLKEELSSKLKEWFDEKYNLAVINNVYKREDIFWGEYAKDAPDIYVGFNVGYRASWQTALGAVPEETIEDNLKKWSGDHLFDPNLIPGIIFSNKEIKAQKPSIYDIAPTILYLTGFDKKEIEKYAFDGKTLFD